MRYRKLGNTDLEVSILGFGASSMGDVFGRRDPADGRRAVDMALDRGITYFDVAPLYGYTLSEQRLGEALRGKRDRVVLSTKCGRDKFDTVDYSAERVTKSIDESLRRLQTDHVDIYQIHDVEFATRDQIIHESSPRLAESKRAARPVTSASRGSPFGTCGRSRSRSRSIRS